MPLFIVRNDITKMNVDAIVNAANNSLLGGGGVDGAIHKAAGIELLNECRTLGGCKTGEAKITKGYNLPAKYVIHTVGPIWQDGMHGEEKLLISCYYESLKLAKENGCSSVAFPLISAGVYGYPKDQAIQVATDTIKAFLNNEELNVFLVIFDRGAFTISKELFNDVREYIDNNYIDESRLYCEEIRRSQVLADKYPVFCNAPASPKCSETSKKLDDIVFELDESFSDMLFRLIDEKGMTDVECYKKANVDRKVFSKIRNANTYRPSKTTAVAFALALELPLEQAKRLIELAGYSMTHNNKFDVIIEYLILNSKYDIFEANQLLFEFDQKLLGC